jgi:uncharacterized membrane protein
VKEQKNTFVCPICQKTKPESEGRPAEFVSGPVGAVIRSKYPEWGPGNLVCLPCLREIRGDFLEQAIKEQRGEISAIEQAVIDSLEEQEVLSRNINPEFDQTLTVGQRLADKVADFGGSWGFIIIFAAVLVLWIGINSVLLIKRPFDPYPYILLNLFLSCIAAVQAPIIMMSQNRQEARDRLSAEHDYQVNLKAEIEIRNLHLKMDQLINHSWRRLLEIQQVQVDLMEDLASRSKK